jgi:hypothetical protein
MRVYFGVSVRSNFNPGQLGIVADDGAAIGRQADIELKAVASVFEGKFESGKCVFARIAACAAVAQQERPSRDRCHARAECRALL